MGVLLSIVVPTFNYGHMLRRSLESVLSQMTGECELVVIDDGSTDDTAAVLESLAASHPNGLRWMRQENAGAASARNHGLRASRGSHVLFLDADDELLPGALATICSAFREHPDTTVVIGGCITRWPDGREKHRRPPSSLSADPCRRVADHLLAKKISISHGAVAVARGLAESRAYPESFRNREDIPVSTFWLARGKVETIDTPLVRIHKHPDSLRHASKVPSEAVELALADEIFSPLPKECQALKHAYIAQRYLSLSGSSARAGDRASARRFFFTALRIAPNPLAIRRQLARVLKQWLVSFFR